MGTQSISSEQLDNLVYLLDPEGEDTLRSLLATIEEMEPVLAGVVKDYDEEALWEAITELHYATLPVIEMLGEPDLV